MHPADIQAELKKRQITQTAIAKKFRVSQSFVGRVIKGETSSHRVARHIASVLEKDVHALWPTRYHRSPRSGGRRMRRK